MKIALAAAVLALVWGASASAQAQPVPNVPYIHKTPVQTSDFPGGGHHTVTVRTVVDPGKLVALHTHPGLEMAYVVSGTAKVRVRGRPDQDLRDGDSFQVPPHTPHELINTGGDPLTVVSTYVVDPKEPIASVAK